MIRIILILALFNISSARGDDINYRTVRHKDTDLYIVHFNPKNYRIKIVKAFNKVVGRDYLSSLAKSSFIGINGGFFHSDGNPVGLLKIKNQVFTLGRRLQSVFGFSSDGSTMIIDQIKPDLKLSIDKRKIHIQRFNSFTRGSEVIVFTDAFGTSALTDGERKEIVVNDKQEIILIDTVGGNDIKSNHMIISFPKNFDISPYKVGQKVNFEIQYDTEGKSSVQWSNLDYIITGIPLLIKDNNINYQRLQLLKEKFSDHPHARTGVCITNHNDLLFAVSNYKKHEGLSLEEFARFLKLQDCRDALNLDGGGSSGFYYKGTLMNNFSKERQISNAILIEPL
jgi:uncharacterized protein YigE (DUF2233 family)